MMYKNSCSSLRKPSPCPIVGQIWNAHVCAYSIFFYCVVYLLLDTKSNIGCLLLVMELCYTLPLPLPISATSYWYTGKGLPWSSPELVALVPNHEFCRVLENFT